MSIKKVGIVGLGLMGGGIAQVCPQSGYQVVVSDINDALVSKGLASISSRLIKDVEKARLSPKEKDDILGHIKGTTNMSDFSDCDLVIEAVLENMDLKKKVFAELDKICQPATILATNTSGLSVMDIATAAKRIDKVLGLHFFSPANIMRGVEIVRTIATSNETMETCKNFIKSIGKTGIVAQDTPGFVANRLTIPFTLNAIRLLEAGVASKEDIDAALMLGFGHPMGPLTVADFAGLDVLYHAAEAMYEELKDPQCFPPVLLKKMVSVGWLGRKTGKGFYDYK